jgi:hypothetical protein
MELLKKYLLLLFIHQILALPLRPPTKYVYPTYDKNKELIAYGCDKLKLREAVAEGVYQGGQCAFVRT